MKKLPLYASVAAVLLSASGAFAQSTIAKWTFETTQPGVVDGPAAPGGGVWITNIISEVGSGTAAGFHSGYGTPTYSSPAGNGTAHSFSSNGWTNSPGDCYQFSVSTEGYHGLTVSFDQIASATGPGYFYFAYSTDGVNFTQFGSMYNVTNAPSWSTTTPTTSLLESFTENLSGVTAINNSPVVYFRLVDATNTNSATTGLTAIAGTCRVDNFTVTGISSGVPPTIVAVNPPGLSTNAGSTATFTVSATGDPASDFWYKVTATSTNLIAGATSATLTLNNVSASDSAGYFVILTNSFGSATSSVVNLTVTGDPGITSQPSSVYGLLKGSAQFSVQVSGTTPALQWYKFDGNSTYTLLNNGLQASGAYIFGATTSTLTITNLQPSDATNFVVVVTNVFGSATSSVATLYSVTTTATLAYWDFNGAVLDLFPYFGSGSATAVGIPTESGAPDINDGYGFNVESLANPQINTTNFSWAVFNFPATGSNKQCGVQFNLSTAGAKNINLSYAARVSPTSSLYDRLQYTTNGTTWLDYPTSSTFNGVAGASGIGNNYVTFSYNLAGFPGVANNPAFGVRVVTEFQSTATYGVGINGVTTNNYVGTANTYGSGGTLTFDQVSFTGDAITNANTPPSISSLTDTNMVDTNSIALNFTVGDLETPASALTVSAASLNPTVISPALTFTGSGANRALHISFPPGSFIPNQLDAAPIQVTVTDGNGDIAVTSFLLTVTSLNLSPTNTLVSIVTTNTLANQSLVIPFMVGDDHTAAAALTYSVDSAYNNLIPAGNIVISNQGTTNPIVTITPATNQVGVAKISITVSDSDSQEPRSTTANIAVMVRPNTNVVLVDSFNYDTGGALDNISGGYWTRLSGTSGQLQAGAGLAVLDTLDNRENVQAQLLGSPYATNSGSVLYASFTINMNPENNPAKMPVANGTYFALFNDGSGATGPYEGRVIASTNGAAPGYYRIGINNFGADASTGQAFPQDLQPGVNYVVVMSLSLSNGLSTVWINPSSSNSPSVTDVNPSGTLYNISAFELRESGANAGQVDLGSLKVGTTFDSVLPALHVSTDGAHAIVSWSDPTLSIQSATSVTGPYVDVTGATSPYTNSLSPNNTMFYRFGQ